MTPFIISLQRLWYRAIGMTPDKMPMVQYWKRNEATVAKVTTENGAIVMKLKNEKYTFPGYPRSHLLFGKLSKLKHEIKNQIFNWAWAELERGVTPEIVATAIKQFVLPRIYTLYEETSTYDVVPPHKMIPAVREIHRAWTKVVPHSILRDIVTYIFQEDDSYRFRFQWMVPYMSPWMRFFVDPVKLLDHGFEMLEHGEVVGDMKERVRLLRRVMNVVFSLPENRAFLVKFFNELDWSKVKMSKADKFYFRGKYFKVDFDKFEY